MIQKIRHFNVIFIVLILSFLISGCSGGLNISSKSIPKLQSGLAKIDEPVGVIDEGWHTGLILSTNELNQSLSILKDWFPKNTKYFVFGWGNRKYYMSSNPGLWTGLKALFPSKSVMFVQGLSENPKQIFSNSVKIRWIYFSQIELQRLDIYIWDYLTKNSKGRLIALKKGLSGHSYFFASPGIYDAFYTCNTWTLHALHFSGLPINDEAVIFSSQVMSEISTLKSLKHKK